MLDYYIIFRIVRKISTPFKDWDAYRTGVIDDKGEIITKRLNRTPEQNRSFDKIELLALKLRKVLVKANIASNPASTLAAALWLIREANDEDYAALISETRYECNSLEVFIEQFIISEEMVGGDAGGSAPTTNTGTAIGYNNKGDSHRLAILKRKRKAECDE